MTFINSRKLSSVKQQNIYLLHVKWPNFLLLCAIVNIWNEVLYLHLLGNMFKCIKWVLQLLQLQDYTNNNNYNLLAQESIECHFIWGLIDADQGDTDNTTVNQCQRWFAVLSLNYNLFCLTLNLRHFTLIWLQQDWKYMWLYFILEWLSWTCCHDNVINL